CQSFSQKGDYFPLLILPSPERHLHKPAGFSGENILSLGNRLCSHIIDEQLYEFVIGCVASFDSERELIFSYCDAGVSIIDYNRADWDLCITHTKLRLSIEDDVNRHNQNCAASQNVC